jgi:hypothetical protein
VLAPGQIREVQDRWLVAFLIGAQFSSNTCPGGRYERH